MSATPALLLAAGGVGVTHAVLPDHWVPLAVISRARRYSLGRVAGLSTLAGLAHVLVSIVLGAIIVVVGLQLRGSVESAQSAIVGSLLIATGVVFLLVEVAGRRHRHVHHRGEHAHAHQPHRAARALPFMVSFGAAASPDLTILPVFLAATAAGAGAAVGSLAIFALVTVATFVVLTLVATLCGYQLRGAWLEKAGNIVTAGMLLVLGVLVLAGVV